MSRGRSNNLLYLVYFPRLASAARTIGALTFANGCSELVDLGTLPRLLPLLNSRSSVILHALSNDSRCGHTRNADPFTQL